MAVVECKKSMRVENVRSLRKKMAQPDVNTEVMKIQQFFKAQGIKKNGSLMTTTFSVEMLNGQSLMDMEILVPMDKTTDLPPEYKLKPLFQLVNAVYARHKGNPANLQNTYNEMTQYMTQNNLKPITTAYNVQVNELTPGQSINDVAIDIYIGVNPNIL